MCGRINMDDTTFGRCVLGKVIIERCINNIRNAKMLLYFSQGLNDPLNEGDIFDMLNQIERDMTRSGEIYLEFITNDNHCECKDAARVVALEKYTSK